MACGLRGLIRHTGVGVDTPSLLDGIERIEWLELKTGLLVMRSLGSTRLGEGVEPREFLVIGFDEYATEHCVQGI